MAYNPINLGPTTTANSQAVVLPSDQVAIPVTGPLTDTQLRATAVAVSLATLPALATGSNAIGSITNTSFASTQSGTWNVGTLTSITNAVTVSQSTATSLKTQAENYQGGTAVSSSNPLYTAQLPINSGGLSFHTNSTTGGNTFFSVSASASQIYGWYFFNNNTTPAYITFYNASTSGQTVGTYQPTNNYYVLVVPPYGGANTFGIGITHSTLISYAIASSRTGSGVLANAVDINIFYKA